MVQTRYELLAAGRGFTGFHPAFLHEVQARGLVALGVHNLLARHGVEFAVGGEALQVADFLGVLQKLSHPAVVRSFGTPELPACVLVRQGVELWPSMACPKMKLSWRCCWIKSALRRKKPPDSFIEHDARCRGGFLLMIMP